MSAAVRLEYAGVAKVFAPAGRGEPVTAVEDVSLEVRNADIDVELPGAGHASYIKQPAAFNAEARKFLNPS